MQQDTPERPDLAEDAESADPARAASGAQAGVSGHQNGAAAHAAAQQHPQQHPQEFYESRVLTNDTLSSGEATRGSCSPGDALLRTHAAGATTPCAVAGGDCAHLPLATAH
jgi:hypothetical protein